MDKTELGCLRAIILFNPGWGGRGGVMRGGVGILGTPLLTPFCVLFLPPPDAKGLSNPGEVELLREKVYASLESYCKQKYPEQQGR